MQRSPLVSVIIANWNGGKVFEECLSSLKDIEYPSWELIVVDNGSNDGTQQYATIKNRVNLGFVKANNQGYKVSKGDYILLLNNDTKVTSNLLNILVEKMEKEKNLSVIQPKIKIMDNPQYLDNAGSFLTRIGFLHHFGFMKKDSKEFDKEREVLSVKGACMFIRRDVIEKIGLFDDDFGSYFEESDFCWRVWLAGGKVLYYPRTYVFHKVGFTIRRLGATNLNWHYYKNRISSLIKNLGIPNLFFVVPLHLLISVGISFAFLTRSQLKSFIMIWKAIWWNIFNLDKTLKKRELIQKNRLVSDKYIFEKLSVPIDWKVFFGDFKRVEEDIKRKPN